MPRKSLVTTHYTRGDLLTRIQAALGQLGKDPDTVTIDDLGPVDEFHVGGRVATSSNLRTGSTSPLTSMFSMLDVVSAVLVGLPRTDTVAG